MALIGQEVSADEWVDIPGPVLDTYRLWRSTPLIRALDLERALGTPARIYYKYEGGSPAARTSPTPPSPRPSTTRPRGFSDQHRDRRRPVGSALAFACARFDLECKVYMVRASYDGKPYRRSIMETWGASVTRRRPETNAGRAVLDRDSDSPGSLGIAISEAVEDAATRDDTTYALGSVLNHVLLHQTVIGLELKAQLERPKSSRRGAGRLRRRRVQLRRAHLPAPGREARRPPGHPDGRGRAHRRPHADQGPVRIRPRRPGRHGPTDPDVHPSPTSSRPRSTPAGCATTATRRWCRCCARRTTSRPSPTRSPRSSRRRCSSPAPRASRPRPSRPTPSAVIDEALRCKEEGRSETIVFNLCATATSTSRPTRTTCRGISLMSDRLVAEAPGPGRPRSRTGPTGSGTGDWGGRFVPEVLMAALDQLTEAFEAAIADPAFGAELDALRRDYAGRPTPLFPARRLSDELGLRVWPAAGPAPHRGPQAQQLLGQHLLTRRMGKPRVIAETGAGQHGVATATVAALLGQECVVYMGEEDTRRQHLNVVRMRLLGAEARPATGTATLKDAINEALRDWVESVGSTHYSIGSVVGPHPYPLMVREFQRVIGDEARAQVLQAEGRLPDLAVACVGAGPTPPGCSPASSTTTPSGWSGRGRRPRPQPGDHGASPASPRGRGPPRSSTSSRTPTARSSRPTRCRPASTPRRRPRARLLKDAGRVTYENVPFDRLALDGFRLPARTEGILPALDTIGWLASAAQDGPGRLGTLVVLNLSGRGDKDGDGRRLVGGQRDPTGPGRWVIGAPYGLLPGARSENAAGPPTAVERLEGGWTRCAGRGGRRWSRTEWRGSRTGTGRWRRSGRWPRPGPTCSRSARPTRTR